MRQRADEGQRTTAEGVSFAGKPEEAKPIYAAAVQLAPNVLYASLVLLLAVLVAPAGAADAATVVVVGSVIAFLGILVAFLDKNGPEYFEVLFGGGKINAVNVAVN